MTQSRRTSLLKHNDLTNNRTRYHECIHGLFFFWLMCSRVQASDQMPGTTWNRKQRHNGHRCPTIKDDEQPGSTLQAHSSCKYLFTRAMSNLLRHCRIRTHKKHSYQQQPGQALHCCGPYYPIAQNWA